jgi:hypothetical protein
VRNTNAARKIKKKKRSSHDCSNFSRISLKFHELSKQLTIKGHYLDVTAKAFLSQTNPCDMVSVKGFASRVCGFERNQRMCSGCDVMRMQDDGPDRDRKSGDVIIAVKPFPTMSVRLAVAILLVAVVAVQSQIPIPSRYDGAHEI